MAESGRKPVGQKSVYHFHFGGNSTEQTTLVQGDQVQNKTDIRKSNIGTVGIVTPDTDECDQAETSEGTKRASFTQSDRIAPRPPKRNHVRDVGTDTQPVESAEKTQNNRTKVAFLKGKSTSLVQNGKCEEARKILEEIQFLLDSDEIDALLLMTECDLHLGRKSFEECFARLRDMILSGGALSARDIEVWGNELKQNGRKVGSILLHRIASDKFRADSLNPNDSINYIRERAIDIRDPAIALAKSGGRSREIVTHHVIKFLADMVDDIRGIYGTDPDEKALALAGCLNSVVYVCNETEQYQRSIHFGSMATDALEDKFGENVSKYQIYCLLLNNLGVAYKNSGRYSDAESCYSKAIQVNDFSDSDTKETVMKAAKTNLANIPKNRP